MTEMLLCVMEANMRFVLLQPAMLTQVLSMYYPCYLGLGSSTVEKTM